MLYYHVYNRGTEKRNVFMDAQDFERFLDGLHLFNTNNTKSIRLKDIKKSDRRTPRGLTSGSTELVQIHAYCLNPNHYHLIISCEDTKNLSKFMQKLGTGFAYYFNEKHRRTGSLFQGTYKKVEITSYAQLLHLLAYVNLNYLLHGISSPNYRSSVYDYFDKKKIPSLDVKLVKQEFKEFEQFNKFCLEHINETKGRRAKERKIKEYID